MFEAKLEGVLRLQVPGGDCVQVAPQRMTLLFYQYSDYSLEEQ